MAADRNVQLGVRALGKARVGCGNRSGDVQLLPPVATTGNLLPLRRAKRRSDRNVCVWHVAGGGFVWLVWRRKGMQPLYSRGLYWASYSQGRATAEDNLAGVLDLHPRSKHDGQDVAVAGKADV